MTDLLPAAVLARLWPHCNQHVPGLLDGIIASAPIVFPKYGLTSSLLVAHAMAQFSEESGAGLEMVENDNFTEAQLLKLFPTHFTGSMAERLQHNPRMICDVAYGGRMGNAPPPSDDGYNYRGRGLSQCTGKQGYEKLAQKTGLDVLNNPGLLSAPATALECGVADFVLCGCLPHAEKDDVIGVTRALNGGLNGLSVREQWLRKWKAALAVAPATEPKTSAAPPAPAKPPAATAVTPIAPDVLVRLDSLLTEIRERLRAAI
jgi:putative chitinase